MSVFLPLPEGVSESQERRGELGGLVWRREGNRAACLYLHGIESHAGWFRSVAGALAAAGTDVWAFDRRGSGLSFGGRPFVGSFETFWDDARALALELRQLYDRQHLVALSWGARLAVLVLARDPDLFDSAAFLTPGWVPRLGYGPAEKLRIAVSCRRRPDRLFDLPIRPEMFTEQPEALEYIRSDRLRTSRVPALFLRSWPRMSRLVRALARDVTCPAALFLAGREPIISPRGARRFFARLGSARKRERAYPDAGHALVFERPKELARELDDLFTSAPARRRSFLVVGAGAVGGYLAACLARRGHRAALLCRPAQAAAIAERGLVVREGGREWAARSVEALEAVPEGRAFDMVLFAVKGYDTSDAVSAAAAAVGSETVLCSFQNGLDNEKFLAGMFPGRRVLAGAICAYLASPEPGVVERTGEKGGVALGSYRGLTAEELVLWADIFRGAGLPAVTGPAADVKWSKLLLNVSFNALSAATGLTVGEILARPELFAVGAAAFREARLAARASGVRPIGLPGYPVPVFCRLMSLPAWLARRMARRAMRGPESSGRSSMWQDLERGRGRTEIADLNGAVVGAAMAGNVECPVNRRLVGIIERAAADPAERERYRNDPALLARECAPAREKEKPVPPANTAGRGAPK